MDENRDLWKKQYTALEEVARHALRALLEGGRYLSHRPDAAQTQACYDWCPKCHVEKARQELLDCLAQTMMTTAEQTTP